MFDEVATERRLRYDDRTNKVVGLGRETAAKTTLEFNSEDNLDTLFADLECGDVRLASEVSCGSATLRHIADLNSTVLD